MERTLAFARLILTLYKDLSLGKSWDNSYNHEGYMALVLAQYEDFFSSLLAVTLNGVRMTRHVGYSVASVHVYRLRVMCHGRGALYLPAE